MYTHSHNYPLAQSMSHSYINMSPGNVTPHSSAYPSRNPRYTHGTHLSSVRGIHDEEKGAFDRGDRMDMACKEVEQIVSGGGRPQHRVSPPQASYPLPHPPHFAAPPIPRHPHPSHAQAHVYAPHQWEQLSYPYYTGPDYYRHAQYHSPHTHYPTHNHAPSHPICHEEYMGGYMNPPPYQHSKKRKFQATQPTPARDYIIYADRSISPALSDITISPAPSFDEDDNQSSPEAASEVRPAGMYMGQELQKALIHLNHTKNGEEGKWGGKKVKPRAARTLQIDTLEDEGDVPKVLRIERHHSKGPKAFTFESSDTEDQKVVRTVSPIKSRKTVLPVENDNHVIFRRKLKSSKPNTSTFYNEVSQSSSGE